MFLLTLQLSWNTNMWTCVFGFFYCSCSHSHRQVCGCGGGGAPGRIVSIVGLRRCTPSSHLDYFVVQAGCNTKSPLGLCAPLRLQAALLYRDVTLLPISFTVNNQEATP